MGTPVQATIRAVRTGAGVVGGAVAEHRPEDIEAAPGQGEHGLDVGFPFHTFTVVVGPGGGAAFRAESPERQKTQEPAVVAAGAVLVAGNPAGIPGCGGRVRRRRRTGPLFQRR
jgi:hypothetical protein